MNLDFTFSDLIAEVMPPVGSDLQRGGWYDVVEREIKPGGKDYRFVWHDRKAWWQQEQAILAYLILHGILRDLKKPLASRKPGGLGVLLHLKAWINSCTSGPIIAIKIYLSSIVKRINSARELPCYINDEAISFIQKGTFSMATFSIKHKLLLVLFILNFFATLAYTIYSCIDEKK